VGSPRYDVIVVGAGGGGVILGLALAQRGVRVCIIERHRTRPSLPRAETIQPNGQQILHRLGLLDALNNEAVQAVQRFHFFRMGGSRLCSVDYGMLPAPWNRALVAQSNKVHELFLNRLAALPAAELQTGVEFQSLIQRNGFVTGVIVRYPDSKHAAGLEASLVVGADGAESLVRQALGLPSELHRYRHGYLTALLPRPLEMDGEGRYHMGRGELLGMFPAPEDRVVVLYMVEAAGANDFRARGLDRFKQRLAAIDPALRGSLENLTTWAQVGFLPCARVRAGR
jgi:monooxygenase